MVKTSHRQQPASWERCGLTWCSLSLSSTPGRSLGRAGQAGTVCCRVGECLSPGTEEIETQRAGSPFPALWPLVSPLTPPPPVRTQAGAIPRVCFQQSCSQFGSPCRPMSLLHPPQGLWLWGVTVGRGCLLLPGLYLPRHPLPCMGTSVSTWPGGCCGFQPRSLP